MVRFSLETLAFSPLVWYSISVSGYWREVDIWLLQQRKSVAKLCLALGLFSPCRRFSARWIAMAAPLPSAVCFLLTNLIYIGLAMAWGFSISRRMLHRNDRRWLLLGCAMAVLWLFLRAVKYRFFTRRYHYAPSVVSVLCAADPCAAVQPVRRAAARAAGGRRVFSQVVSAVHSCCTADRRHSEQRPAPDGVSIRAGRCDAGSGLYPRLDVLPRHDVDGRAAAGDRNCRLLQVPCV